MARTNFGIPSTGLPSNLYSGAAVTFDTRPYVSYYLQQQAHKQAQEDAMYRYFGELGKGLSPAGMDGQDIPGLMQRKNAWQAFDMQNRKAIARPGLDQGKAYAESMSRYNDMLDYINRSKAKIKKLSSLAPVLHSPQKDALLNDATQLSIHYGSLALDDPNYKEFDPTTISYNPPPFDAKQANAMRLNLSQYKPSDSPVTVSLPNHQQQTIHNYKFNSNDLNGIYVQGVTNYHNNPSFRGEIDKIKESPDLYNHYNELFKEHYNRDMYSGEDAAAGYMLSLHPDIANKVEQPRNVPYSPWESAAAREHGQEQFYNYRQQQQAQEGAKVTESYMTNLENQAKKGHSYDYMPANGQTMKSYKLPMNEQLQKAFEVKSPDGKKTYTPDEVHVLANGDWLPQYYKYEQYKGPDGKTHSRPAKGADGAIALDSRLSQPVSREIAKTNLDQVLLTKKSAERQGGAVATPPAKTTEKSKKTIFGTGGLN